MLNYEFICVEADLSENFVMKTDFFEAQNLIMRFCSTFVTVYELSHFCLSIPLNVLELIISFEMGSEGARLPGFVYKGVIIEAKDVTNRIRGRWKSFNGSPSVIGKLWITLILRRVTLRVLLLILPTTGLNIGRTL